MLKFVTIITAAVITMVGISGSSYAQSTAAIPASTNTSTVSAANKTAVISPEQEKLIQRLLQLWHVENIGVVMLQQPVAESLRQSRSLLQGRVSTERQEATMKEINQDAKKFIEEAAPLVIASAQKLIPSTVEPILAEKFTEEELRQIIAILESKVKAKFEALAPEIEKTLGEKIANDTGPTINPKLTELTQQIGQRMRTAVAP